MGTTFRGPWPVRLGGAVVAVAGGWKDGGLWAGAGHCGSPNRRCALGNADHCSSAGVGSIYVQNHRLEAPSIVAWGNGWLSSVAIQPPDRVID